MSRPPAGLCDTCVHQQLVSNTRGSTFSLCRRARDDPAYPKYPRVPVLRCPGHEVGGQQEVAAGGREPEQQPGGAAPLLAAVPADRGQRGLRGGGGRHVVEPDHGEAAGHGDPAVGGRRVRAER